MLSDGHPSTELYCIDRGHCWHDLFTIAMERSMSTIRFSLVLMIQSAVVVTITVLISPIIAALMAIAFFRKECVRWWNRQVFHQTCIQFARVTSISSRLGRLFTQIGALVLVKHVGCTALLSHPLRVGHRISSVEVHCLIEQTIGLDIGLLAAVLASNAAYAPIAIDCRCFELSAICKLTTFRYFCRS